MADTASALNSTLREFNLKRGTICELSGVSESMLSRYLTGESDITSNRLQAILMCLPSEAKSFFYSLVDPESFTATSTPSGFGYCLSKLKSHLEQCSQEEYLNILGVIIEAREARMKQGANQNTASKQLAADQGR